MSTTSSARWWQYLGQVQGQRPEASASRRTSDLFFCLAGNSHVVSPNEPQLLAGGVSTHEDESFV